MLGIYSNKINEVKGMLGEELQLMMIDYILLWGAAITAMLGIGLRVCLGIRYGRLIDEVDKMTTTKNRDLKRCKIKYEKCHAMNQGVANVGAFVDRFLSKLSIGPFTYLALYQMGAQMILLSVILMALLICHRILEGESLLRLLPYYAACFAGLYVFLTITVVVNVQEKRNVLKISLVDYLENHLTARLESVPANMAKIRGEMPGGEKMGGVQAKSADQAVGRHAGEGEGRTLGRSGEGQVARGKTAAVSVMEETKTLPRVKASTAGKVQTVSAVPTGDSNGRIAKEDCLEPPKVTTHDYQELSKLLEDFFAV